MDAFYRGELKVGLKYLPSGVSRTTGTLVIDIKQAKELPAMDTDGLANSAVKLYLLPNRKSSGKRKTGVIKKNLKPVWEEKFTYENVSLEELSHERVLEVSVWDYDKSGHTFIGGLRLGSAPGSATKHKNWMDSIGDEVTHWEDMLARPGEWVEQWHTLRTTLNPRNMDLQVSTPPLTPSSNVPSIEEEPATFTPMFLADEFKKTTPSITHGGKNTKDIIYVSSEYAVGEISPAPLELETASKPVFSSSMRSRPDKATIHTTTPWNVGESQTSLSTRNSENIHVQQTPSGGSSTNITVESERIPPLAHSTPTVKGIDLSEVSAYTAESPGSVESHMYPVSYL